MTLEIASQISGIISCIFSLLALIGIGVSIHKISKISKQVNEPKIVIGNNNQIDGLNFSNKSEIK